jgi:hypothetical protein
MEPPQKSGACAGKIILVLAALAIVVSGLFPPWLYTIYATGTREEVGYRSEKSAGYHFLLRPPPPEIDDHPGFGVKLDGERLLIEWVCIVAAGTAAWTIVGMSLRRVSEADQEAEAGGSRGQRAKISTDVKVLVVFGIIILIIIFGILSVGSH